MHQLTEQEANFLYADDAWGNANVTLLHIYDQSTAPHGKVRFKDILAHVESRLDRLPAFRQKLLQVPLDLDFPYWIDDQDFSIEYHVRHIALPKPGDWRQFCIQASRLHARRLDLDRPLWELYVIEGLDAFLDLPPSSFAVLLKIHRAAKDVDHINEVTAMLHDLAPRPGRPDPQTPWFPEPPPPNSTLLYNAWIHSVLQPWRRTRPIVRLMPHVRNVLNELSVAHDAPVMTRFNSVVSPYRVFDTRRFSVAEFERIVTLAPGATIDHVAQAICGGGLRRYLELQGELPAGSLIAARLTSLHKGKDSPGKVLPRSGDLVPLHTDLEDPLARLRAIWALAGTEDAVSRGAGLGSLQAPRAHCSFSLVPGPQAPLYLKGARMAYFSAILPISDGMGLAFAVTRYDDKVVVSFTSCHEQLPDPEVLAQCVRDSFQEYLALADVPKRWGKSLEKIASSLAR